MCCRCKYFDENGEELMFDGNSLSDNQLIAYATGRGKFL